MNADVATIDIHFVDEHDAHVNPIGEKGVAVFHATGKRVRDLPIRSSG